MNNSRFLNALHRQPVDCTPVWLMRQAGRYLPEYRALREKAGSFLALCQNPEFACEVTLQPFKRFDLDAAILFADILTIADAMGLGLNILDGKGPVLAKPVRTEKDIAALPMPAPERDLDYVLTAIKLIRNELKDKPLIGFAGSPWTLAAYVVEGQGTKEFYLLRSMLYREPHVLHQLLQHLTLATITYLRAQINAGVQAVMLFDTWGGLLNSLHYQAFSLYYIQEIVRTLKSEFLDVPVILYCKNGMANLEARANTGVDALGLDWTVDIGKAREQVGDRVALQGNIDPAVLYATPDAIRIEVKRILDSFGKHPGHVFNLGHGVPLDVPIDNVKALIDAVHELSGK